MTSRRMFLAQAAGLALAVLDARRFLAQLPVSGSALTNSPRLAGSPMLTIYKSPTCGCCTKWVDHVRAAGFRTVVHDEDDMDRVKERLGVPKEVRSCHTAQVSDYLIEGHVPAEDIARALQEHPKVAGLAVPGMPTGTPGMATPGAPAEPYQVVAFQKDGSTTLYASH